MTTDNQKVITSMVTSMDEKSVLNDRVTINISGKQFVTRITTLNRQRGTRLTDLNKKDPNYDEIQDEYFFDRNPAVFPFVLDFYRTGELHFSHSLCGPVVKRELEFWRIPDWKLSACCWRIYKQFDEEQSTLEALDDSVKIQKNVNENEHGARHSCRSLLTRLWLFLEDPSSSHSAKVWCYFCTIILLISITIMSIETHHAFRVPADYCPLEYVTQVKKELTISIFRFHTHPNATTTMPTTPRIQLEAKLFEVESDNKNMKMYVTDTLQICPLDIAGNVTNPKLRLYLLTVLHPVLEWTDRLCSVFFMVELVLRFIAWPGKFAFLTSPFNLLDLLAIPTMFADKLLRMFLPFFWLQHGLFTAYAAVSASRVLRAFRVVKILRAHRSFHVLLVSIRASMHELLLLAFLLMAGMLIFSTMIYYAEFYSHSTFLSVPQSFWWAIITMTTVGYGDMVPNTLAGYIVGSMCALTGLLLTALPIAVIAGSFHWYYTYAKVKATMEKKRARSIKLPN